MDGRYSHFYLNKDCVCEEGADCEGGCARERVAMGGNGLCQCAGAGVGGLLEPAGRAVGPCA